MLENTLAHVAGQEQAIRRLGRQSREKPQLSRSEVLRFVNNDMVERLRGRCASASARAGEDVRPRRVTFGRQRFAHRWNTGHKRAR